MSEYDEPWRLDVMGTIRDRHLHAVEGELLGARAVACVNACAGIEDPAALRAQRDELLAALIHLRNEVRGCIGMGELELREIFGNTNYTCLENRVVEAEHAIAKAKGESHD